MSERFSVITISFNHGLFIERTIKSVLSQEGNFFLEYLVIDGGSTDGSLEIIKKYDRLLKEGQWLIKCLGVEYCWFSEPDEGPTHALNKGMKMATGDFISFLNSDDVYPEGTLQSVVAAFREKKQVDVIYGDTIFIDEQDSPIGFRKGISSLRINHFRCDNALVQPEVFLRGRVIEKMGLFDEKLGYSNDYEYWVRLLSRGVKFSYLPRTLVYFRVRNQARSSGVHPGRFIDSLTVQYRYFGPGKYLAKNLGEYAAEFSEKSGLSLGESLKIIASGFRDSLPEEKRFLVSLYVRKGEINAFLKKAIYLSFKDRKKAKAYLKQVTLKAPLALISTKGASLLLRLLLGKRLYRILRRLGRRFIGGGDVL